MYLKLVVWLFKKIATTNTTSGFYLCGNNQLVGGCCNNRLRPEEQFGRIKEQQEI
jgi:hypothetical protein